MVKKVSSGTEAEAILDELRRLGWVKGFVVKDTSQAEEREAFAGILPEKLFKCYLSHKSSEVSLSLLN